MQPEQHEKRGGKRDGAGRPQVGREPRRNRLSITLTDTELARLTAWAAARHLSLSQYIGSIASRLPEHPANDFDNREMRATANMIRATKEAE